MSKPEIVFFGSGPVALRSLQLLADYCDIEAIVTKPATRQIMERAFPNTPVFTVARRAELDELCVKQRFKSPVGVLIDFGVIVDQDAINSFPLGIINSHFSLLPEWRGVDPITFSILSGQAQTGVSLMLIVRAWDEGPLLAQAIHDITPGSTTPSLTQELIELSNALLKQALPLYLAGTLVPAPQEDASLLGKVKPTYSRKLTKEDGKLDWNKSAEELEREVRAYIEWPHSYTTLAGKDVTITASRVAKLGGRAGTINADKQHLYVYCGKDALEILRLKPAGKSEMPASAFLAGYRSKL